jgi:hypothetical protein
MAFRDCTVAKRPTVTGQTTRRRAGKGRDGDGGMVTGEESAAELEALQAVLRGLDGALSLLPDDSAWRGVFVRQSACLRTAVGQRHLALVRSGVPAQIPAVPPALRRVG